MAIIRLGREARAGFKKRQRESGSSGHGRCGSGGEGLGAAVALQRAEKRVNVGVIEIKSFPWFHFWSFELEMELWKPPTAEGKAREFEVRSGFGRRRSISISYRVSFFAFPASLAAVLNWAGPDPAR